MERAHSCNRGAGNLVKVFIVSDMEGVAGIVKWQQVDGNEEKRSYHEGRKLYTEEINAAVRGAKSAGAKEIVVMDCHGAGGEWTFNSLVPEELDPSCEYVVQNDWTEYTELLEQGCDAALFVAMHAKAGTPDGVLSHTVSGQAWRDLQFNGVSVGETGINAALCGQWGCPVVLVTGDEAVCKEATALLGDGLTTVAVKRGLGRFSARQLTPLKARELIEDGAKRALKDLSAVKPYDPGRPSEIRVEFTTPDRLIEYRNRRGTEQVDDLTLVSKADDWWTAWSQFYF
ncbi:MAG: D-amino peptidase [Gaiellaceae bacterium]|nr:D-amino peptidase [Gaiellaceae bacterium]